MARSSSRQPYLSPATGGEDNPFSATMKLSPEAADDLRELAGYSRRVSKAAEDPVEALAKLRKKAGVRLTRTKSIINTASRGDEDKQRIATPWAFIHALEQRFGTPVDFDLAAEPGNAKADEYFSPAVDALKQDWSDIWIPSERAASLPPSAAAKSVQPVKLAYLNSPFATIQPWARKLADCRWLRRWTVALWPASFSTDWFLELRGKVLLDAIPRIQFEGATHLYPKDLVLAVAGFGVSGEGYWDWRASYWQWCHEHKQLVEKPHDKGMRGFPEANPCSVLPDFAWTPDPFLPPR